MPVLGITGGICTGKSTFVPHFCSLLNAGLFDSDVYSRALLAGDASVREKVTAAFGAGALGVNGWPDRVKLREIVFSNVLHRRTLEAILHPLIRERWMSLAEQARVANAWLCVDIPLLYETGVETCFDCIVVLACSTEVQFRRLLERRGLDEAMAAKIVSAQGDLTEKMRRANHVIWNDGSLESLAAQTNRLAQYFLKTMEQPTNPSPEPLATLAESPTPVPLAPSEAAPFTPSAPVSVENAVPTTEPALSNAAAEAPTEPALPKGPEEIWIDELNAAPLANLIQRSADAGMRYNPDKNRHQLVLDLVRAYLQMGTKVFVDGIVETSHNGNSALRWPRFNFRSLPQDVFVPPPVERHFGLRNANRITARIRLPRDKDKGISVDEILTIEGIPAKEWKQTTEFEKLTAMHPTHRLVLENQKLKSVTARFIDIMAPLGHGQRGLIVAPPRVGKTVMLKEIAEAILANEPDCHLLMLLVDERPEEVTDFRRTLNGAEIYSSTFDESPQRHTHVAEMVGDRARRLVELRKRVVILLDSITRLSRGYNNMTGNKGRLMSGGVDSKALVKPKKFFGAARNTEEGGSLTILATALVETNSKMDDLIFEEYKGTGNMEIRLDRTLGDQRIFPAINTRESGTRRDDLLYNAREYDRISVLRKQLAALPPFEQSQILIHAIKSTHSNAELLLTGLR